MATKTSASRKTRKGKSARASERAITHSVNHPVRLDALSILIERVASPKEISEMLRVSLGTASFHVGELLADGAIELVDTEQRRGALEHYYRAKVRPEITHEEWAGMPKTTRRQIAALALQAIVTEGLSSLRHGKMDADENMYLVWIPMTLDAEGEDEVTELHAEMLERLEAIKAKHKARAAEGGDAHPERIAAMMWFERGQPGRA